MGNEISIIEHPALNNNPKYPVGLNLDYWIREVDIYYKLIEKDIIDNAKAPVSQIHLFCTGSSGAIISALIASKFDSRFNVVISHIKKDGEISHSSGHVFDSGINDSDMGYIVDDLISSGQTMIRIIESLTKKQLKITRAIIVSGDVDKHVIDRNFEIFNNIKTLYCGRYNRTPSY